MSIFKKLKGIRASRWMAIIAVAAMIPLASGCAGVENAAFLWNVGYYYEWLYMGVRSVFATGLLDFINTH